MKLSNTPKLPQARIFCIDILFNFCQKTFEKITRRSRMIAEKTPVEKHGANSENHFAVDVVLEVFVGLIADAHRLISPITFEVSQNVLAQFALPSNAIDWLE